MKVIRYQHPDNSIKLDSTSVALGYFDGVHVGHRALLSLMIKKSKEKNLIPCVFTFDNIPPKTNKTQTIIYNIEDKLAIFEQLGVKIVILADFKSISNLEPYDFVKTVLVDRLDARVAVSGYNFRFGKEASGCADDLSRFMNELGRDTQILEEQTFHGVTASSTYIRELLKEKRLDEATTFLGIPFFIRGRVEKGLGLGKGFGFPTVNLSIHRGFPLPLGVYRTAVKIDNKLYTGITNIGSCPTICERDIHAETLIADFNGNLYGKDIEIFFLGFLREEKLFDSVEELRDRIFQDKETSIKENGDLTWLATGLNLR